MRSNESPILFSTLRVSGDSARQLLKEVRRRPTNEELKALRDARSRRSTVSREVLERVGLLERD